MMSRQEKRQRVESYMKDVLDKNVLSLRTTLSFPKDSTYWHYCKLR